MRIRDFFRHNVGSVAKPARSVPRRILGAYFESLEPRCLLSVAPATVSLIAPDKSQYADFYVAPLVTPGQVPSSPPAGQQLQLQPVEQGGSGTAILNGMNGIGGLHNNATPGPQIVTDGTFEYESRAVLKMLSSLQ
jgi:hypothetical protein